MGTGNRPPTGWSRWHWSGGYFPHAACVVALVNGLVHCAEVSEIEAENYRRKEGKELNATRTRRCRAKKP
ncbi:hypothetical protein [Sorangium atrum]|uniref:Uncharacterized protein n=1 Tax=Sorangium atrum TaxID=2995308 RepID=A0ABT5C8Q8_9BACT|nr:hypothetical protein [Sorangium aterium]MDC0681546.1 hypothetical protein [Sorangium aterium]